MGQKMQLKINFLCRDSILVAPVVLDLVLFLDLANRAKMRGIQEWLSFYFKSPEEGGISDKAGKNSAGAFSHTGNVCKRSPKPQELLCLNGLEVLV